MYKSIILPASILAGTIIGAGMFSLPFVFKTIGILDGLFYLSFFSAVFILTYIIFGDIILRTPGEHRFIGYAKIYFGEAGFWASLLVGLVQLFFILTIYLILSQSFFNLLFPIKPPMQILIFWLAGSMAILLETKRIAFLESLIISGIIAIIFLIFGLGFKNFFNLPINSFHWPDLALAGPILFALSGGLAIPEVIGYFKESVLAMDSLKKALILGGLLPAFAYIFFVFGILSLSKSVSQDSVSGLIGNVPPAVLYLLGILGMASILSSYIAIGLNTRRILQYDLLISEWLSKLLVVFIPIILYIAGLRNFFNLITFIGVIFLPIENLAIIAMWFILNKKPGNQPLIAGKLVKASAPILFIIFLAVLVYVIIK